MCHQLGLPETVRDMVTTAQPQVWTKTLSQTQRHLLGLSRALVSNPELLCLAKPLQPFDEFTQQMVLLLLKKFVKDRGIDTSHRCRHLKGPRTCVFTTNLHLNPLHADMIVHVCDKGLRVDKSPDTATCLNDKLYKLQSRALRNLKLLKDRTSIRRSTLAKGCLLSSI